MASHSNQLPAATPANISESETIVVDTSSQAKRRFSSRNRLLAHESVAPKLRNPRKSSPRKTSTPQNQLAKDAAFARMLHEEDFGFRGKEPKTRKPVVKAVTKLSKNGNKETEIRTYDGRDGKGLKYIRPVYPAGTKYFTKVMMGGEVIGRLSSIAGEKGSDLSYGRECEEDVSMKDKVHGVRELEEDISMRDDDSELSEIESDDSEPVRVRNEGTGRKPLLGFDYNSSVDKETSDKKTPVKTISFKASPDRKTPAREAPAQQIPIKKTPAKIPIKIEDVNTTGGSEPTTSASEDESETFESEFDIWCRIHNVDPSAE